MVIFLYFLPQHSLAHQNPSTIALLDVSPGKVGLELQIPLSELELAYGHDISKNPEAKVPRQDKQLKDYILAHIHPTTNDGQPWKAEITDIKVEEAIQVASGPAFQEITVHLILTPPPGAKTREFILNYDIVMHQVVTHTALVSIRNDWEKGINSHQIEEVGSIRVDSRTSLIYPLKINLEKGSWFTGFRSMIGLGMQHIKEGTDHLLFLLVLLLPATLLANGKHWGEFAGTRYSIVKLVKTTTAFTVGHSLTLLISALKLVQLSPQPVEVLIAFSILISAIHAVRPIFPGKEMYVAAGFGLVHGLAFASVLSNLNLSAGPMAISILGFNIGIELMQLFVILLVIPGLILLSSTRAYTSIRVTSAVLAAIASIAWTTERITGTENSFSKLLLQGAEYGYMAILLLAVITIIVLIIRRFKTGRLSSF